MGDAACARLLFVAGGASSYCAATAVAACAAVAAGAALAALAAGAAGAAITAVTAGALAAIAARTFAAIADIASVNNHVQVRVHWRLDGLADRLVGGPEGILLHALQPALPHDDCALAGTRDVAGANGGGEPDFASSSKEGSTSSAVHHQRRRHPAPH